MQHEANDPNYCLFLLMSIFGAGERIGLLIKKINHTITVLTIITN